MTVVLTEPPSGNTRTFLDFPLQIGLDNMAADIAVLGVPYGLPYTGESAPNEQSRAPDALRRTPTAEDVAYTRDHYDFDLGGLLLDGRDIRVVDCGNVTADAGDPMVHYHRAEQAARKIFSSKTALITLGGDHGVPIPIMRALEVFNTQVTLVHIDAHLDWRHEINGVTEGYSSPIRRAAEMPWIGKIVQIGLRGIGSARAEEVAAAREYGATLVDAYTMHQQGMDAVLAHIPDGGPYYLTIDADGIDPTIMPAVMAQTPGGITWVQLHHFIHGLVNKGRVLGMDLVEIAPARDTGATTLVHAERLICNYIGAAVRAGYFEKQRPD
jgi:agmatinase